MQLSLGVSGRLLHLKSWLCGYQVKVSQNIEKPKARYFSVCFTAPKTGWKLAPLDVCKAHTKAVGKSWDDMTICQPGLEPYLWRWSEAQEELSHSRYKWRFWLSWHLWTYRQKRRERQTANSNGQKGKWGDNEDGSGNSRNKSQDEWLRWSTDWPIYADSLTICSVPESWSHWYFYFKRQKIVLESGHKAICSRLRLFI